VLAVVTMVGAPVLAVTGEVNDAVPSLEAVIRLLAAGGLGAVVGLEREANDQPAGLRTHLTVALGAALFGVISTLGFSEFVAGQRDVNIQFDVTRVASQVVVGIGFLGAGVIFRSGSRVRNLTTAASLWATAAVGLAAGVGDIGVAVVGAAVLLVALMILRLPRDWIRSRITRVTVNVSVRLARPDAAEAVMGAVMGLEGVKVLRSGWAKADGHVILEMTLEGEPRVRVEEELAPIVSREDVLALHSDVTLTSDMADGD
jgi:putative Mg2+ transporter-C (MgtC) family protein